VIESLSRLGRSTKDLLSLIEESDKKGITLISLKENIDLSTPTGRLLLTVLSELCQFERDLTVQRTYEVLQAARARGPEGGRPKTSSKLIELALTLYDSKNYSIKVITERTGISQGTLYKAINERKQAGANK